VGGKKDKPQSFWRARLARSDAATFLPLNHNESVGLVSAFVAAEDGTRTELVSMWVAPQARGQSVGRQLVAAVTGWALRHGAASIRLWVTETSDPARRLYESCGFVYSGERQSLASDSSLTEVEMRLTLE
jgi:GNAT superfamily N-acetyltransferase